MSTTVKFEPPGELGDDHPLSLRAREYAFSVIEGNEWPLDNVQLDRIRWETSSELGRKHGEYRWMSDGTGVIRVSTQTYEQYGWEAVKETIRHELVHALQHQQRQPFGHEDSFKQWIKPLNLSGTRSDFPRTERYGAWCRACGARIRGSPTLDRRMEWLATGGREDCPSCNDRREFEVQVLKNGTSNYRLGPNEILERETIRTVPIYVTDRKQIQLDLTLFPGVGVGTRTARKLLDLRVHSKRWYLDEFVSEGEVTILLESLIPGPHRARFSRKAVSWIP